MTLATNLGYVFTSIAREGSSIHLSSHSSVSEQVDQLVGGESVGGVGAFEKGIGQVALGVVELDEVKEIAVS